MMIIEATTPEQHRLKMTLCVILHWLKSIELGAC